MRQIIAAAIFAAMLGTPAMALDQAMENWLAIPEDPSNAPYCVLDQKLSTALAALKAKGATPTQMMRWGEVEAEKYETQDRLLPLGVQESIMILAQDALGEYPPGRLSRLPRICLPIMSEGKGYRGETSVNHAHSGVQNIFPRRSAT